MPWSRAMVCHRHSHMWAASAGENAFRSRTNPFSSNSRRCCSESIGRSLPRARLQCHHQAVTRAQGEDRIGFARMSQDAFQMEVPGNHGEHELSFDHGELPADATARAATKGEVRKLRPLRAAFRREALRIE